MNPSLTRWQRRAHPGHGGQALRLRTLLPALALLWLLPALGAHAEAPGPAVLFQYSTIAALLQGCYDGDLSLADLARHGDFAIGTVNGLDGELIELDGTFYQARTDGRVYPLAPTTRTPFAVATFFRASRSAPLPGARSLNGLEQDLDALITNPNHFHAIRIHGTFPGMKVRSVPAQSPPYRPLTEIVAAQAVFDYADISGTLVGFFTPAFMGGLNVPGYHFHFLSDDHSRGGHVLALTTGTGRIELEDVAQLEMLLPDTKAFAGLELQRNSDEAVRRVERQPTAERERPAER